MVNYVISRLLLAPQLLVSQLYYYTHMCTHPDILEGPFPAASPAQLPVLDEPPPEV